MGRIADAGDTFDTDSGRTFVNKMDRVLGELDDDDRRVVLSWLADADIGDEQLEMRLVAFDIFVSDSTIRRWRNFQRAGMGRVWGA